MLLDINLIGSSGLELLVQILALNPAAVVVMLTAVNVRHTIEDAVASVSGLQNISAVAAGTNGMAMRTRPVPLMHQSQSEVRQIRITATRAAAKGRG